MAAANPGGEEIRIQQVLDDDPVQTALKQQEKQLRQLEQAYKRASKEARSGAEGASKAQRDHSGAMASSRQEASLLSGAIGKLGPLVAGAFSVSAIKAFVTEVQNARNELGKIGQGFEQGATQSALNAGLSRQNQTRLRAITSSVDSAFSPEQRTQINDAVLAAVAPQTAEQERAALDLARRAQGLDLAVGGQAGVQTATEIATAAGKIIRQEPELDTQQALDMAARAIAVKGGKDAIMAFDKNQAVLKQIAPELSAQERAQRGLALGTYFQEIGLGAETGGSILTKLDRAQREPEKFRKVDEATGRKVDMTPDAMRSGTLLQQFEQLVVDAKRGDERALFAADKIFGEQAGKILGGDLNRLREIENNMAQSAGEVQRRAERQTGVTQSQVEAQRIQSGLQMSDAQREAPVQAGIDLELARIEQMQRDAGRGLGTRMAFRGMQRARQVFMPPEMVLDDLRAIEGSYRQQFSAEQARQAYVSPRSVPGQPMQRNVPEPPEQNERTMQLLERIAENTARSQPALILQDGQEAHPAEL